MFVGRLHYANTNLIADWLAKTYAVTVHTLEVVSNNLFMMHHGCAMCGKITFQRLHYRQWQAIDVIAPGKVAEGSNHAELVLSSALLCWLPLQAYIIACENDHFESNQ